jgi:hypothetical protein
MNMGSFSLVTRSKRAERGVKLSPLSAERMHYHHHHRHWLRIRRGVPKKERKSKPGHAEEKFLGHEATKKR